MPRASAMGSLDQNPASHSVGSPAFCAVEHGAKFEFIEMALQHAAFAVHSAQASGLRKAHSMLHGGPGSTASSARTSQTGAPRPAQ